MQHLTMAIHSFYDKLLFNVLVVIIIIQMKYIMYVVFERRQFMHVII